MVPLLTAAVVFLAYFSVAADAFYFSPSARPGHGRNDPARARRHSFGAPRSGKAHGKIIGASEALPPAAALQRGGGSGGGGGGDEVKPPGIWGRYLRALERRPVLTKSLSSGVISGTANFVEQTLSRAPFSISQWTAFTLVGTVYIGTVLHHWYNLLERVSHMEAVTSRVRSKWGVVLLQVGLDQTFGAAMVNSGYFAFHTVFLAAFTGQVFPLPALWSSVGQKVTSRFWTMMANNLKIWPWVTFVNFAFVPADLRVLVSNVVAVFWGYLMSKWCK